MRRFGVVAFEGLLILSLAAACALGIASAQQTVSSKRPPNVGTLIDSSNVEEFSLFTPPALAFAIRHGLRVKVIPSQRIEWPAAYQQATEKYAGQVRLDGGDAIQNYLAGLPFPLIDASDAKAGVKVAYNWRWGPFIPATASLITTQKTDAYSINPSRPAELVSNNGQRDYRNENDCEQMTLVRYAHLAQATDAHSGNSRGAGVEWKERSDRCGPENGAIIGIQHLDPSRDDDMWVFFPGLRKWRQMKMRGGYPHQSCTYTCAQFFWEYAPPKTEVYSCRLLEKRPLLACLSAKGVGSGISASGSSATFPELNCELRQAYVLEMRPRDPTSEVIIPAQVFIDSETYLDLGADFFRDRTADADIPLWSFQRTSAGDPIMLLANDFYVPADRLNFFISLNLTADSEKIGADRPSENLFNPRAQEFSDGRM